MVEDDLRNILKSREGCFVFCKMWREGCFVGWFDLFLKLID